RSCEKQGCNKPAEVAFGIDRMACVVWLENYDEDEPRHLNRLCDEHAARLTLPRGWSFDDRRERSPRLFVASRQRAKSEVASKSAAKPTSKPRKSANKTGAIPRRTSRDTSAPLKRMDGPGLFDPTLPMNSPRLSPLSTDPVVAAVDTTIDTVAVDTVAVDTVVDTTAPAYAPKFDRTSDVGGALNATGRLLRRAFSSQTKPIERPTSDDDTASQRRASNTDSLPQGDHIDDFNQGDHVE
ncbi:MAG: DUF3499 family protein, partial [Actinomycetota bacterium]